VLEENPEVVDQNYLKKFEGFQDFINSTSENTLLDNDIS
jgi:hypothetical protein